MSLSSLIEDFYTVSSLDSFDYPYILTTISLSEILREQVAQYYVEIEKKYSSIDVDIVELPCYIKADRTSLQRIFLLYENADKNIADKIFERNYSVNWATSSKSTGLGLSIAKSMTEKMGGSIGAEVLDDMLVFTIEFEKSENHSNEMV